MTTLTESFESGTKTAYTAGNVTLSSGSRNFNDALSVIYQPIEKMAVSVPVYATLVALP
ncbi:hypothetical protein [Niastella populi]|uniref:hypothetical protein n=1 Tax=Niastella populi TaxID=550983 RepID=UPI001A997D34|nr:hypothetical protein [Niastella populi]